MPLQDLVATNQALADSQASLMRTHWTLEAMLATSEALNRAATPEDVFQAALEGGLRLPDVGAGWIVLRDSEGNCRVVASRNLPPCLQEAGAFEGGCECRRKYLSGSACSAACQIPCDRLQGTPDRTAGMRCHASIPLSSRGRTLGVLNLAGPDAGSIRPEDLGILQGIGHQIGVALERAELQRVLQHQARSSADMYRALMERAGDGIGILDRDGVILEVNDKAQEILGRDRLDLIGRRGTDLGAVKDLDAWDGFFRRVLEEGVGSYEGFEVLHSDGSQRWVDLSASTAEVGGRTVTLVIARDVTAQRRAQEAQRESAERLRALVVAAPVAIILVDPDGVVQMWNPAAERIFGWSAEDVVGRFNPIIPPESLDEFRSIRRRVLEGEQTVDLPIRRMRRDGSRLDLRLWTSALRGADGRPCGLLGMLVDVTERESLEAQLRQAQKMEAIGRLAGGVAHDFNNLLTLIIGYTRLLLIGKRDSDPERAMLDEVLKAADRATGLTRQLLAFSRKQLVQPRVLDLNAVVLDVAKMLRRLVGEDIRLEVQPGPDLGQVMADYGQIEQVLMNLVVNARDAMASGGKIEIATANVRLEEEFARTHPGARAGEFVQLWISDNGCGMDETTRTRIFEPFFTTKAPGKGTGLGLATVYGIVKQAEGYIEVESEPGGGTIFRIYWPRLDQPAVPTRAAPALPTQTLAKGTGTVLLVEDEQAVNELAKRVLTSAGYSVLVAMNGEEAIRALHEHAGTIDVLLTDVVMPGRDGREVAAGFRARHPGGRVIFMTGFPEHPSAAGKPMEFGGLLLQKPFTPQYLCDVVREVLSRPPARASSTGSRDPGGLDGPGEPDRRERSDAPDAPFSR